MEIFFKDQIKVRKGRLTACITEVLFKEGDIWVSYAPSLDISSYGDSVDAAAQSLQETVSIVLLDLTGRGTLQADLAARGWAPPLKNPSPTQSPESGRWGGCGNTAPA